MWSAPTVATQLARHFRPAFLQFGGGVIALCEFLAARVDDREQVRRSRVNLALDELLAFRKEINHCNVPVAGDESLPDLDGSRVSLGGDAALVRQGRDQYRSIGPTRCVPGA